MTDPAHVSYEVVTEGWTVHGLLRMIAAQPAATRYSALLDTGALVTGMSNLEVATFLLVRPWPPSRSRPASPASFSRLSLPPFDAEPWRARVQRGLSRQRKLTHRNPHRGGRGKGREALRKAITQKVTSHIVRRSFSRVTRPTLPRTTALRLFAVHPFSRPTLQGKGVQAKQNRETMRSEHGPPVSAPPHACARSGTLSRRNAFLPPQ